MVWNELIKLQFLNVFDSFYHCHSTASLRTTRPRQHCKMIPSSSNKSRYHDLFSKVDDRVSIFFETCFPYTPRKFNIAPKDRQSQKETSLPIIILRGYVKFRGCISPVFLFALWLTVSGIGDLPQVTCTQLTARRSLMRRSGDERITWWIVDWPWRRFGNNIISGWSVVNDHFYVHPYLGKIPILFWRIFFKGVDTTN